LLDANFGRSFGGGGVLGFAGAGCRSWAVKAGLRIDITIALKSISFRCCPLYPKNLFDMLLFLDITMTYYLVGVFKTRGWL
jgi:hypothetical protein